MRTLLVALALMLAILIAQASPALAVHEPPPRLAPGKFACLFSGGGPMQGHDVTYNLNAKEARTLEESDPLYSCTQQRRL